MKKGFTLVEMAIVLVVIGILMGIVYKGSDLIDSARLKDDINKALKIKSAMSMYHTKFNTVAGDRRAATITNDNIYNDLINEGLLTPKDFALSKSGKYYHFTGCENVAVGWGVRDMAKGANNYICLFVNSTPTASNTASKSTLNKDLTYKEICFYESVADDKNVTTGEGRSKVDIHSALGNYSCKGELKATEEYLYRVF